MNNKFLSAVILCAVSKVQAEVPQNQDDLKTTVEISQGYRRDALDVKFSRHDGAQSFHQKNKFKGVDTYTTRLSMTVNKNDFFVKGIAGYGNVYGGKLHQKSTFRDGYRSKNVHTSSHVNADYTADFALTFGKDFFLANDLQLSPSLGYGVYLQNFHTGRAKGHFVAKQHYPSRRDNRGTYRESKERYKASWYSPQFGLSVRKALTNRLAAYAQYTFLFPLSYHASGSRNLQSKKAYHYEQENKAYKSFGNIGTIGLDWNFAQGWSLKPEFEFMKFYSKGGDSAHRYSFKKAERTSTEYRLVLSYLF